MCQNIIKPELLFKRRSAMLTVKLYWHLHVYKIINLKLIKKPGDYFNMPYHNFTIKHCGTEGRLNVESSVNSRSHF
jgi:hypothetical protein